MEITTVQADKLAADILEGVVVLPDFQREFVWKADDVADLLVSILGDYYIGTMLYMEALATESPFALKLVSGVHDLRPNQKAQSIVKVLLDGQQRSSSLFYALYNSKRPLAGRKSPFRFYIDFKQALRR